MKRLLTLFSVCILFTSNAQQVEGTELGLDGTFFASTNGGTIGIGAKYGFKFGEYIILGPSLRYQRSWTTNVTTGTSGGFNVFGGGGFFHARFFNALFLGTEIEFLRSPYTSYGYLTIENNWVPTVLIGGGYSMEFNESWRLNLGIMYDVVDKVNSPLRTQYFLRNSQGVLLPVIYRIAFFFPLS